MLKFKVITVLPSLIEPHIKELPFKRAIFKELVQVEIINLRNYALDTYGTIDGKPYGGGVGMILRVEPIYYALTDIYPDFKGLTLGEFKRTFSQKYPNHRIVLLDPKGKTYTQGDAEAFASLEQVTFICGRYEGVDERVGEFLATARISIGNYVLSGGEIPALTVMESITRLIPGVIENPDATKEESFTYNEQQNEYPQYTRPENFLGEKVPEPLLSGHHKNIEDWRRESSKNKVY